MDPYGFTLIIWLAIGDIGDGYTEHRFDGFSREECYEAAQLAKEKLTKRFQGGAFMPHCQTTKPEPGIIDPSRRR
jgi:hypothetical protein